MEKYTKKNKLGEGAWGVVTEAIQNSTGRRVAIKKIRMGKYREGVNFTALREVKILRELKHENIVELVDVFMLYESINLVFEFCATDLETIIMDMDTLLTPADVKCHAQMLLRAMAFCHENGVLHRDLKPTNLLYTSQGIMKLADFGLARLQGSPGRMMTSQVVTRWYRPPELCFGCREYSSAVDVWGVGCILAELLLRRPLFPGNTELEQAARIFQIMGTPNEANWPDATSLPDFVHFTPQPKIEFANIFTAVTPDTIDLLSAILVLNPAKRINAQQALDHPYFSKNSPTPSKPTDLTLPITLEQKGAPRPRPKD